MNIDKPLLFKTSRFNFIVYSSDGFDVIYNTLQDSITSVKKDIFTEDKDISYHLMGVDEIRQLHTQGVIVNTGIDEFSVFRYRNMSQKMKGKRLHIFLTLTGACNCNCPYCFAHDCYTNSFMKKDDIPLIMDFISQQLQYHRSTLLNIDFFGGEPLLCEDVYLELMKRIQTLCDKWGVKVAFQFYSNGTIRPLVGFAAFKNYDVTYLITLDGPKDMHDKLRPMKNGHSSFSLITNNLLELKKENIKAVIRINFGKTSYVHIPALLDEIISLGLLNFPIEFYPVQNMSQSSAEYEDAVSAAESKRITEFLWNEAEKKGIRMETRTTTTNCYCSAFTNSMFVVDPNLYVYKCALLQCDKKFSIGNLKEDTDFERDSVFYDWLNYDPSVEKGCRDCICLPICAGGCGGSGTFRYGTHHHSNCYDLSPSMVKMRMRKYIVQKYSDALEVFSKNDSKILILEKSRFCTP